MDEHSEMREEARRLVLAVLRETGATPGHPHLIGEGEDVLMPLLAEVRRLRAEVRQTHLALAAIVQRAGGEVTISMRDVVAVDPRAQLVVYEDPGLLTPALHVCLEPPRS